MPAGAADSISAALEESETLPALAVSAFEQPGGMVEVAALYEREPSRVEVITLLWNAGDAVATLRIEAIAERNWVAEAEALRGPVRAGRFLVHGRHDRGKVPQSRHRIEIDAGLAFGTAHHATTRGCLIALDRLLKRGEPQLVYDIGTGTGILAIAAARTSAAPVIASDIDPIAVATARGNAKLNGVASRVRVVEASGLDHPMFKGPPPGLLFANILLKPLVRLAPDFARVLPAGGICILSGLLAKQAREAEAAFRAQGFTLDSRILLDGWAILVMVRMNRLPRAGD